MKTFKNHPVVKFLRIILHIISLCLFSYFLYRSIKNQSPMWHKIMEIFLIVCALIDLYLDRHLFLCTKKKWALSQPFMIFCSFVSKKLIAHNSSLIAQRRLEDAKPEGRIAAGSWTRGRHEALIIMTVCKAWNVNDHVLQNLQFWEYGWAGLQIRQNGEDNGLSLP